MVESFITDQSTGLEPEYVLVLETIGKIENFERAVRKIKGMEWLAEIDDEELEPDEDYYLTPKIGKHFFEEKIKSVDNRNSTKLLEIFRKNKFINDYGYFLEKPVEQIKSFLTDEFRPFENEIIAVLNEIAEQKKERKISGRLFLSMSNRKAMDELLGLWKKWDSPKKKLDRGYGAWVHIFKNLKSIRKWDIRDRIRETGVMDYWRAELELRRGTASKISFEVELWFRDGQGVRQEAQKKIKQLILEERGEVIAECEIEEIRFLSIKAKLPPESIEKVLGSEYTKLFSSNDVMFFRPIGQTVVEKYSDGEISTYARKEAVGGYPVVAILDGSPFVKHELLENRLIFDDPDDFDNSYSFKEKKHGTAMASLVCHGELDAEEPPLTRPVYIRPIMKPGDMLRIEQVPEDVFLEDIIERSVRRIFGVEGNERAEAPTVKVINLSIGDSFRMFFHQLSPTARLIDWLSHKYQVLFCVSAGNLGEYFNLRINEIELKTLSKEKLIKHTITELFSDIRQRKILSPSESLNAITVGAIHSDRSKPNKLGNRIDILPTNLLPSAFSAHGHGFRNSIKPEIYIPGGRQLYMYQGNNTYCISDSMEPPGQKVATSPVNPGEINRYIHTRGTSNAAALATRSTAQIFEVLNELRENSHYDIPDEKIAVVLKALLIHSASWGESGQLLEDCLKSSDNARQLKKTISRFLGYGIPDIRRVLECTSQRATAIGFGEIEKDKRHEFRLPLPSGLSGSREKRRLTITLAWFSPINPEHRKFRKANLSFNPPTEEFGGDREEADGKQVKNGTVQHEILVGDEIRYYEAGEDIVIAVECRSDAGTLDEKVNYGLAVTLEVAEGIDINIYEEIKERLKVPVQIQDE